MTSANSQFQWSNATHIHTHTHNVRTHAFNNNGQYKRSQAMRMRRVHSPLTHSLDNNKSSLIQAITMTKQYKHKETKIRHTKTRSRRHDKRSVQSSEKSMRRWRETREIFRFRRRMKSMNAIMTQMTNKRLQIRSKRESRESTESERKWFQKKSVSSSRLRYDMRKEWENALRP